MHYVVWLDVSSKDNFTSMFDLIQKINLFELFKWLTKYYVNQCLIGKTQTGGYLG